MALVSRNSNDDDVDTSLVFSNKPHKPVLVEILREVLLYGIRIAKITSIYADSFENQLLDPRPVTPENRQEWYNVLFAPDGAPTRPDISTAAGYMQSVKDGHPIIAQSLPDEGIETYAVTLLSRFLPLLASRRWNSEDPVSKQPHRTEIEAFMTRLSGPLRIMYALGMMSMVSAELYDTIFLAHSEAFLEGMTMKGLLPVLSVKGGIVEVMRKVVGDKSKHTMVARMRHFQRLPGIPRWVFKHVEENPTSDVAVQFVWKVVGAPYRMRLYASGFAPGYSTLHTAATAFVKIFLSPALRHCAEIYRIAELFSNYPALFPELGAGIEGANPLKLEITRKHTCKALNWSFRRYYMCLMALMSGYELENDLERLEKVLSVASIPTNEEMEAERLQNYVHTTYWQSPVHMLLALDDQFVDFTKPLTTQPSFLQANGKYAVPLFMLKMSDPWGNPKLVPTNAKKKGAKSYKSEVTTAAGTNAGTGAIIATTATNDYFPSEIEKSLVQWKQKRLDMNMSTSEEVLRKIGMALLPMVGTKELVDIIVNDLQIDNAPQHAIALLNKFDDIRKDVDNTVAGLVNELMLLNTNDVDPFIKKISGAWNAVWGQRDLQLRNAMNAFLVALQQTIVGWSSHSSQTISKQLRLRAYGCEPIFTAGTGFARQEFGWYIQYYMEQLYIIQRQLEAFSNRLSDAQLEELAKELETMRGRDFTRLTLKPADFKTVTLQKAVKFEPNARNIALIALLRYRKKEGTFAGFRLDFDGDAVEYELPASLSSRALTTQRQQQVTTQGSEQQKPATTLKIVNPLAQTLVNRASLTENSNDPVSRLLKTMAEKQADITPSEEEVARVLTGGAQKRKANRGEDDEETNQPESENMDSVSTLRRSRITKLPSMQPADLPAVPAEPAEPAAPIVSPPLTYVVSTAPPRSYQNVSESITESSGSLDGFPPPLRAARAATPLTDAPLPPPASSVTYTHATGTPSEERPLMSLVKPQTEVEPQREDSEDAPIMSLYRAGDPVDRPEVEVINTDNDDDDAHSEFEDAADAVSDVIQLPHNREATQAPYRPPTPAPAPAPEYTPTLRVNETEESANPNNDEVEVPTTIAPASVMRRLPLKPGSTGILGPGDRGKEAPATKTSSIVEELEQDDNAPTPQLSRNAAQQNTQTPRRSQTPINTTPPAAVDTAKLSRSAMQRMTTQQIIGSSSATNSDGDDAITVATGGNVSPRNVAMTAATATAAASAPNITNAPYQGILKGFKYNPPVIATEPSAPASSGKSAESAQPTTTSSHIARKSFTLNPRQSTAASTTAATAGTTTGMKRFGSTTNRSATPASTTEATARPGASVSSNSVVTSESLAGLEIRVVALEFKCTQYEGQIKTLTENLASATDHITALSSELEILKRAPARRSTSVPVFDAVASDQNEDDNTTALPKPAMRSFGSAAKRSASPQVVVRPETTTTTATTGTMRGMLNSATRAQSASRSRVSFDTTPTTPATTEAQVRPPTASRMRPFGSTARTSEPAATTETTEATAGTTAGMKRFGSTTNRSATPASTTAATAGTPAGMKRFGSTPRSTRGSEMNADWIDDEVTVAEDEFVPRRFATEEEETEYVLSKAKAVTELDKKILTTVKSRKPRMTPKQIKEELAKEEYENMVRKMRSNGLLEPLRDPISMKRGTHDSRALFGISDMFSTPSQRVNRQLVGVTGIGKYRAPVEETDYDETDYDSDDYY